MIETSLEAELRRRMTALEARLSHAELVGEIGDQARRLRDIRRALGWRFRERHQLIQSLEELRQVIRNTADDLDAIAEDAERTASEILPLWRNHRGGDVGPEIAEFAEGVSEAIREIVVVEARHAAGRARAVIPGVSNVHRG